MPVSEGEKEKESERKGEELRTGDEEMKSHMI
jgi:hypothetical protein